MKKLLAILLALVMVLSLFAACGNKSKTEDKDDDKTPASDEETTEESSAEESSAEESDPEASGNPDLREYVVKVVDEEENPLTGVMVQFCDENGCTPAFTDEDGIAKCVTLVDKTVKIADMPEGYDYATEQTEWDLVEEGNEVTIVLKKLVTESETEGGNNTLSGGNGGDDIGDENNVEDETFEVVVGTTEEQVDSTEDFDISFEELT